MIPRLFHAEAQAAHPPPRAGAAVAFAVAALLASTAFAISRLVDGDIVGPDVTRAESFAARTGSSSRPGDLAPLPPRPSEQRHRSRRRRRDRSPEPGERVEVLLGAGDPDRRHRRPGTGSRRPEPCSRTTSSRRRQVPPRTTRRRIRPRFRTWSSRTTAASTRSGRTTRPPPQGTRAASRKLLREPPGTIPGK